MRGFLEKSLVAALLFLQLLYFFKLNFFWVRLAIRPDWSPGRRGDCQFELVSPQESDRWPCGFIGHSWQLVPGETHIILSVPPGWEGMNKCNSLKKKKR